MNSFAEFGPKLAQISTLMDIFKHLSRAFRHVCHQLRAFNMSPKRNKEPKVTYYGILKTGLATSLANFPIIFGRIKWSH